MQKQNEFLNDPAFQWMVRSPISSMQEVVNGMRERFNDLNRQVRIIVENSVLFGNGIDTMELLAKVMESKYLKDKELGNDTEKGDKDST